MGESVVVNFKPASKNQKSLRPLRLAMDWPLILTVLALLVIGLIFVFSASWMQSLNVAGRTDYYLRNQIKWAIVGTLGATVLMFIDYRKLSRFVVPVLFIAVISLVLVLIFGDDRYNSRRAFAGGSVQPSEFAKVAIIFYLAYWLYKKNDTINNIWYGLIPMGFILGMVSGLIILEPDLSAALTIVVIGGVMFFLANVEMKQIAFIGLVVGGLMVLMVTIFPTGHRRFMEYWSGLINPVNSSFHIMRSLEAVVRGGVFGVGIGNSTTKFTGLPVSHTDSIFAVILEETGLIGGIVVVALYATFLWRGLLTAQRSRDPFGQLLASGLTLWIVMEAVLNMGVMVNLFPFAGNTLPLISAGGSSLLSNMVAIGLLLSVARVNGIEGFNKAKEGRVFSAVADLRGRNGRRSVPRSYRSQNPRK